MAVGYDGRDKSFWFFSYEGYREPLATTRNRVVLTPRVDGSGLAATLIGALAALLSVSAEVSGNKKPSAAKPSEGQLSVVAGACSHCHYANLSSYFVIPNLTPAAA